MTKLDELLADLSPQILSLGFLILYFAFVFPAMPPVGDAADYASSIRLSDFGTRTIHIGYNIFVFPFVFVGRWLGFSTTAVLNMLAACCMAASIGILHRCYVALGCQRSASTLGCLIFGTTGIIWYHAEFGEVQALLILCIATSIYFFLEGRALEAGILFAFALLVSQAAAPSVVCFALLAWQKKSWPEAIKFGGSLTVSFLAGVAPIAKDYFVGPRGVLPSLEYYPSVSFLLTVGYFLYRVIENHTIWAMWLAVGAIVCYRRYPNVLVGIIVLWGSHAWLNMKLSHVEYGFAWMPFFMLSSLVIAIGALWTHNRFLAHRKSTVTLIPLCIIAASVLSCLLYVLPKRMDALAVHTLVHEARKKVGEETLLATAHLGFVYIYETNPSVSDVWESNWKPVPPTQYSWNMLMLNGRQTFLLLYKHHTHLFRQLIFDNPITRLLWSEEKRIQYRDEGIVITRQDIYEGLPRELCLEPLGIWGTGELLKVRACTIEDQTVSHR